MSCANVSYLKWTKFNFAGIISALEVHVQVVSVRNLKWKCPFKRVLNSSLLSKMHDFSVCLVVSDCRDPDGAVVISSTFSLPLFDKLLLHGIFMTKMQLVLFFFSYLKRLLITSPEVPKMSEAFWVSYS